jgi:hypothetical protein
VDKAYKKARPTLKEKEKPTVLPKANPHTSPTSPTLRSLSPAIIAKSTEEATTKGTELSSEVPPERSALSILSLLQKPPTSNKPSTEVRIISHEERESIENQEHAAKRKRAEQQHEERRKRGTEKARNNHRQRLLKEAKEGGYTISPDELDKRLDAYMKKREVCIRLCDIKCVRFC